MKKLLGLAAFVLTLNAAAHALWIERDPSQNWMTIEATSLKDNTITWRFDYTTALSGVNEAGTAVGGTFFADYIGDEDIAVQTRQWAQNSPNTYLYGGINGQLTILYSTVATIGNWGVGTGLKGMQQTNGTWWSSDFAVTYNGTVKPPVQGPSTSVPEPSTAALLIGGLSMLGLGSLRRKKQLTIL